MPWAAFAYVSALCAFLVSDVMLRLSPAPSTAGFFPQSMLTHSDADVTVSNPTLGLARVVIMRLLSAAQAFRSAQRAKYKLPQSISSWRSARQQTDHPSDGITLPCRKLAGVCLPNERLRPHCRTTQRQSSCVPKALDALAKTAS